MKSVIRRTLTCTLLTLASVAWAHDTLPPMTPFGKQTWAKLLESGPRPAAYMFTTTYCATCPDAFEQMHKAIQEHAKQQPRSKKPVLAVVITDAQNGKVSAHAHHFAGASRLYAFDGHEAQIRYTIDPQWRNITPYIAMIDAKGKITRSVGAPEPSQIKSWLAP